MIPKPFIRPIPPETLRLLERIYRQGRHHQVRQPAHCLLLRTQGLAVSQLRSLFSVTAKTIDNWFDAWDARGMFGLYNRAECRTERPNSPVGPTAPQATQASSAKDRRALEHQGKYRYCQTSPQGNEDEPAQLEDCVSNLNGFFQAT